MTWSCGVPSGSKERWGIAGRGWADNLVEMQGVVDYNCARFGDVVKVQLTKKERVVL